MSDENKCVSQEPEFKEPQVVSSSRVVCLLCFIIIIRELNFMCLLASFLLL